MYWNMGRTRMLHRRNRSPQHAIDSYSVKHCVHVFFISFQNNYNSLNPTKRGSFYYNLFSGNPSSLHKSCILLTSPAIVHAMSDIWPWEFVKLIRKFSEMRSCLLFSILPFLLLFKLQRKYSKIIDLKKNNNKKLL